MIKIILPPREKIIKTSIDDSGPERYFSRSVFIRKIYVGRLQTAIDLVGERKYNALLEIGYGNGMLFPTFSQFSKSSYGIDVHDKNKEVSDFFKGNFLQASVYNIPFARQTFDCIFCLSVLEHLDRLEDVFLEIKKVAKNNADIILGIPDDNFFIKLFFLFKKSPALHTHINNKKKLFRLIRENFKVMDIKELKFFGINLYTAIKCHK